MRKIVFTLILFAIAGSLFAQNDSLQPPYKRFPFFPPVKLLLPDSINFFTKKDLDKKKAVMLMIFNPQCEHCQHATEELVQNIDKFKDIQVIMTTSMPFDSMLSFREKYQLAKYPKIVLAQDTHWFLPTYYMLNNLPFLAFYNKKKDLISVFAGSLPVSAILEVFKD